MISNPGYVPLEEETSFKYTEVSQPIYINNFLNRTKKAIKVPAFLIKKKEFP